MERTLRTEDAGTEQWMGLFDREGTDTNVILQQAASQGMNPVIPPKKNRLVQRDYDKYLYQLRH